jgi:hypothetical protein
MAGDPSGRRSDHELGADVLRRWERLCGMVSQEHGWLGVLAERSGIPFRALDRARRTRNRIAHPDARQQAVPRDELLQALDIIGRTERKLNTASAAPSPRKRDPTSVRSGTSSTRRRKPPAKEDKQDPPRRKPPSRPPSPSQRNSPKEPKNSSATSAAAKSARPRAGRRSTNRPPAAGRSPRTPTGPRPAPRRRHTPRRKARPRPVFGAMRFAHRLGGTARVATIATFLGAGAVLGIAGLTVLSGDSTTSATGNSLVGWLMVLGSIAGLGCGGSLLVVRSAPSPTTKASPSRRSRRR